MSTSTTYLSRITERILPGWTENCCVLCASAAKKDHVKYCVDHKHFEQGKVIVENITNSVYPEPQSVGSVVRKLRI